MTGNEHIVIVTFETTPENQSEALEKIGAYVDTFLSQQPGFIDSRLHRGLDGTSLVHYARWRSEADFQTAGEKARVHPDLPALRRYKPAGRGYTVWASYPRS
ncbi:MAG: antibiotic biosynthesis monooxygenase [Pseudomonadales bacterium]|jgi:heme-degrading monooxygenase HmoA